MEVDTTIYEQETGRKARGYGRWIFSLQGETQEYIGRYAEGAKSAIALAVSRGDRWVKLVGGPQ